MAKQTHETVQVAPGRTIYHGGGVHGFVAGEILPLPVEHAADLREGGHVVDIGSADRDEADQA